MFDIGFSELFLIMLVALIVLGPERLPKAARFVGMWVRKARTQWNSVKYELERELEAEDIKRQIKETNASIMAMDQQLRETKQEIEHNWRDHDEDAEKFHPPTPTDVSTTVHEDADPAPDSLVSSHDNKAGQQ